MRGPGAPVFRWTLESLNGELGLGQTAFQVVVLSEAGDPIADSGKVDELPALPADARAEEFATPFILPQSFAAASDARVGES